MSKDTITELALLRVEVATLAHSGPAWMLLDWVRRDNTESAEMHRLLERFARIVISLQRQASGSSNRRVRNEPYADVLGVRCKLGARVVDYHLREAHEALLGAPTIKDHPNEQRYLEDVTFRASSFL